MSYYPDTDEIRMAYVANHRGDGFGNDAETLGIEFDRWLKAHDAEIIKQERDRLAGLVWEEKQKVFEAIVKDPTNLALNAYRSGLYRALDIIEGDTE